jgi:glycosyltransferase involved in cell wall biosynthesis
MRRVTKATLAGAAARGVRALHWRFDRFFLRPTRNFPWYFDKALDAKPSDLWTSALAEARARGLDEICIAASFPLTLAEIDALLARDGVSSVAHKDNPKASALPKQRLGDPRLGYYWEPGQWQLPERARHIYFLGSWRLLTRWMIGEALRRDVATIAVRCGRAWRRVPLRLFRYLGGGRRLVARALPTPTPELFRRMRGEPGDFVAGRVVLVCGNLSPGGAERQVAYTMLGLARQGLESVQLLCDHLTSDHPARYDFYLSRLREAGLPVRTIRPRIMRPGDHRMLPRQLASAARLLPPGLVADVANLYWEFVEIRPEIVHAWLDWSNVRAGLAAALAGVPKILISGRNLNPSHFALYQPYMDPVYKALCEFPNVTFLNNSRAGAVDYADWLGLSHDRIKVIRNGIDFPGIERSPGDTIAARRAQLGIEREALVIGGVFRLYPEKRPLLWIETAAEIAARHPRARFVIWGQGILRSEVLARAEELGIGDRLSLPGVTDDVLTALSAMDVLLLTSSGEGLPNVVLEAQWVGTPVVATNAGGTAEAVEPGVTGWIVDAADSRMLAAAVNRLLDDPPLRRRCLTSGPDLVKRRFGVARMIDETMAAYGYPPAASPPLIPCSNGQNSP